MNKICVFNPYGLLQVDLEPLRSPLDPSAPSVPIRVLWLFQQHLKPFQSLKGPIEVDSTPLQMDFSSKRKGEPVGTIVEKNN